MRVAILIELETVFPLLGCLGLLRHPLFGPFPLRPWLVFVVMAVSAVARIAVLLGVVS